MERFSGPEGIECFRFRHESGAEAVVAAHGGHVTSWKTADGLERFFLSETSNFGSGQAIRGGVPVIFPQFSDHGPFGRHGFARRSLWRPDPENSRLLLRSSEKTRKEWPHDFELRLSLELGEQDLRLFLEVHNPGENEFEFHAALHTYLQVSSASEATVSGLENLPFFDEAQGSMSSPETLPVRFGKEVDRAYHNSGDRLVRLSDGPGSLKISSSGFTDVVVWNPGPEHGIGDLPDGGWSGFVCVEAALMHRRKALAPGETWVGSQSLEAS